MIVASLYNIISIAFKKLLGLALYYHAWYGKTENLLLQGKLALESYITKKINVLAVLEAWCDCCKCLKKY